MQRNINCFADAMRVECPTLTDELRSQAVHVGGEGTVNAGGGPLTTLRCLLLHPSLQKTKVSSLRVRHADPLTLSRKFNKTPHNNATNVTKARAQASVCVHELHCHCNHCPVAATANVETEPLEKSEARCKSEPRSGPLPLIHCQNEPGWHVSKIVFTFRTSGDKQD